jgi:hypothetical protein
MSFNRTPTAAVHARATSRSMLLRAGMAVCLRVPVNSTFGPPNHERMSCPMKRLQNAMLCVIGVMSVMALYLAARSPSEQLADVAARLDAIEARLADRDKLDVMHASLASDIDSQGVIRSAEGNVIGYWGVDQPIVSLPVK